MGKAVPTVNILRAQLDPDGHSQNPASSDVQDHERKVVLKEDKLLQMFQPGIKHRKTGTPGADASTCASRAPPHAALVTTPGAGVGLASTRAPTLHALVRAADEANKEADAASAAEMTTGSIVVDKSQGLLGGNFSWMPLQSQRMPNVSAATAAEVTDKAAADKADKADKAVMSHLLQLAPTALEDELRSLGETTQPNWPPWQLRDRLEGLDELRAVLRLFARVIANVNHFDDAFELMQKMLAILLRSHQETFLSNPELGPALQALHKAQRSQTLVHKSLRRMKNRLLHAAFEEWRDGYLESKEDWDREALDPPPSPPASDRRVSSSRFVTPLGSQLPPPPAAAITDEMKAELAKLKDLFDGGLLPEHLYEAKLKMMLGLPSTLPATTEYKELGVLPRIPSRRFSGSRSCSMRPDA